VSYDVSLPLIVSDDVQCFLLLSPLHLQVRLLSAAVAVAG
jgi:hypothetical protein